MASSNIYMQAHKRAIAYSFLAHIRNSGTLVDGPLDVFIPIVKNAMTELYPNGQVSGASLLELTRDIEDRFGLNVPTTVLTIILKKIAKEVNELSGKEDMIIYEDGAFIIRKFAFEEYKEQIKRSREEVSKVIKLFKNFSKIYDPTSDPNEVDLLKFIEQNRADISYYLANESNEESVSNSVPAQFVDMFRKTPKVYDVLRNMYLGSMLTSYLSFQPQNVKMNVELLLDTNFIVSLLDLNTQESTAICRTCIETSRSLGYSLTVLKDTIDETQSLLSYKAQNLGQALIARSINKEDIFNACDRRSLSCTDLERISDNLEETLVEEFGCHVIPYTDKIKNIARHSKEFTMFKDIRTSNKSALHDAMAVHYVKQKRGNRPIYEFEKVNCWFVNNSISHYEEKDILTLRSFPKALPETIKVDSLLNIIWLSNPSNGAVSTDFIDMGIASMVSYALNSTLPKARIIKELDDNIQKYRNDFSITDKDVVNLSTRIVQRQITDIQAINDLASQKRGAEFAEKVKLEASKQEQIDKTRAIKLDSLMNAMGEEIQDLRQHKANLVQKHSERMATLKEKEEALHNKEVRLELRQKELKETSDQLQNYWGRELEKRDNKWQEYQERMFKRKRKVWFLWFWGVIGLIVFVVIVLVCIPTCDDFFKIALLEKKWLSDLISVAVAIFVAVIVKNYNDWYHNPEYENKFKEKLHRPKDMQRISFEEFLEKKE